MLQEGALNIEDANKTGGNSRVYRAKRTLAEINRCFERPLRVRFTALHAYTAVLPYIGLACESMDPDFTTRNITASARLLRRGKDYEGLFFRSTAKLSSEECLVFCQARRSVCCGEAGLASLVYLKKDFIPDGTILSFNTKELLWKDSDEHTRVPLVRKGQKIEISYGYWINGCIPGDTVVCFVPVF